MEKGISSLTRGLKYHINQDTQEQIDLYIGDALTRDYLSLSSNEEVTELFGTMSTEFISSLKMDEIDSLRYYTGFSHKEINALKRGVWTYERNGLLTDERKAEYQKTGDDMERIIFQFPSLERDMKVYRGTNLDSFRSYGINSIEELIHMEGKYFYDSGFTSTSLIRDKSLLGTKEFFSEEKNIEIEYLVTAECQDGALLLSGLTSHYTEETEYLMNSGNLVRIMGVEIDSQNNKAFIRAILIPKKLWDPMAIKHLEEQVSSKKSLGV